MKKLKFILMATTMTHEDVEAVVFSDGTFTRTNDDVKPMYPDPENLKRETWERRGWTVIEMQS